MATIKEKKAAAAPAADPKVAELARELASLVQKVSALESRLASCEACCAADKEGGDFVTQDELRHLKKKIAHAARIRL